MIETEDTKINAYIDSIITFIRASYSEDKSKRFFTADVRGCIDAFIAGINQHIENGDYEDDSLLKIANIMKREAKYYDFVVRDYVEAKTIQNRLTKMEARIKKILTPKQTQAERNAEFQGKVVYLLTKILQLLRKRNR